MGRYSIRTVNVRLQRKSLSVQLGYDEITIIIGVSPIEVRQFSTTFKASIMQFSYTLYTIQTQSSHLVDNSGRVKPPSRQMLNYSVCSSARVKSLS